MKKSFIILLFIFSIFLVSCGQKENLEADVPTSEVETETNNKVTENNINTNQESDSVLEVTTIEEESLDPISDVHICSVDGDGKIEDSYCVKDGVFYKSEGQKIEQIDTESLQDLPSSYYKDKNNVYFVYYGDKMGIVKGADLDSFKVISNDSFAKDKKSVFYGGGVVPDLDPSTFEIVKASNGMPLLLKDNDSLFVVIHLEGYNLIDIKNLQHSQMAHIATFEYVGGEAYYKDRDNVYYINPFNPKESVGKIEGADSTTFEFSVEANEARDKDFKYVEGKLVD